MLLGALPGDSRGPGWRPTAKRISFTRLNFENLDKPLFKVGGWLMSSTRGVSCGCSRFSGCHHPDAQLMCCST